jgi:integrase/recombinase XerD
MGNVTTSIYLDKRRKKANDGYPLKLRVTYQRQQKYYPLYRSMTEEEFDKLNTPKPRHYYKEIKLTLNEVENRAHDIINKLDPFSFRQFERSFLSETSKEDTVLSFFENYIEKLKSQDRIGTADSYNCAYQSIKKYCVEHKYRHLSFTDVDVDFLNDYEKWMTKSNNRSITTVGIYLRCVRTLFNEAMESGVIQRTHYPFSKRKYIIPTGKNIKRALTIKQIESIMNYRASTMAEERARDLWILSYALNGIQTKDLAQLKYENIDDQAITYFRAKTIKTSKKELTPIRIPRNEIIDEIIGRWKNPTLSPSPNQYIFDVLEQDDTEEIIKKKTRQFSKTINKYMDRIGKDLEIPYKVTTKYTRHSAATILMQNGASILYIGKNLGHQNTKTTESYLDSFSDDIKDNFQSKLFDFKS